MGLFSLITSLVCNLLLIPVVREVSIRLGKVSRPREDRWHRIPTPTLGGVGIFLSFFIGLLITVIINHNLVSDWGSGVKSTIQVFQNLRWGFLLGSTFIFCLGLYDDFKRISPPAKLIGQIVAATIVIAFGFTTRFFTPRLENSIVAGLPNILLTYIWIVGITNAINLLDNMDGLAGGISLITTGFLAFLFWRAGNDGLFVLSLALAGSTLGFLFYNFPPAKIFMGDSGSMFLGFTLAVMAIAHQPQASNVFAVMAVPTLLLLLPILDTILVTVTRILRGQSPADGGKDHTSHRLIAFGLTERQTLIVLYGAAFFSGLAAIVVEEIGYTLSLIFIPLLVIALVLLSAYLGGIKISIPDTGSEPARLRTEPRSNPLLRVMLDLTFKRRILEVVLDFVIIILAYYLAFVIRYGLNLNFIALQIFLSSLPYTLVATYLSFFYYGVYRGVWRYVGVSDFVRYIKAVLGAVILTAGATFAYQMVTIGVGPHEYPIFSSVILLLFGLFLFLGLAFTRSSFKVLDSYSGLKSRGTDQRILIIGAGDAGEMALRWILMNPYLGYKPVGFLDVDPFKSGRNIHGIPVMGGLELLEQMLDLHKIEGVILAEMNIKNPSPLNIANSIRC